MVRCLSNRMFLSLQHSQPDSLPSGQARFKIINSIPCDISGTVANHSFSIPFDQVSHGASRAGQTLLENVHCHNALKQL